MSSLTNSDISLAIKPDLSLVSNCISPLHRELLIKELGEPKNGYFTPLPFSFNGIQGIVIIIDFLSQNIASIEAINAAKPFFYNAIGYSEEMGAKIVAFTAATKRFGGKNGNEAKKKYPNLIFTIGDNGTTVSMNHLINHFLESFESHDRFVVYGGGFLGEQAITYLLKKKLTDITVISEYYSNDNKDIKIVKNFNNLDNAKKIKMFICCADKKGIDNNKFLELIDDKECIIIDVAVPSGVGKELFELLPVQIKKRRFDGGNYEIDVKYDFNPAFLNFPKKKFWYGCFTEATMLAVANKAGENLKEFDFFKVNDVNMDLIIKYLQSEKVAIPMVNFLKGPEVSDRFYL